MNVPASAAAATLRRGEAAAVHRAGPGILQDVERRGAQRTVVDLFGLVDQEAHRRLHQRRLRGEALGGGVAGAGDGLVGGMRAGRGEAGQQDGKGQR